MARQRVYTRDELLDATERLLVEKGYDGFHLKGLAEALQGARSTIYEYYANKDEIIASCMRRSMERILHACRGLQAEQPVAALKKMMLIFLEFANFHQIMSAADKIKQDSTAQIAADLLIVEEGHDELKSMLISLFERARSEGKLRTDIPIPAMAAVFMHAIDTPNWLELPSAEWAEYLFSLWWKGAEEV